MKTQLLYPILLTSLGLLYALVGYGQNIVQTDKLTAFEEELDYFKSQPYRFGSDIAIDNDYAVITGDRKLYVFKKQGGDWDKFQELPFIDEGFDDALFQEMKVAISGNHIVAGGRERVLIYELKHHEWHVQDTLTLSNGNTNGSFDNFGFAVDIWEDKIVVGLPGYRDNTSGQESIQKVQVYQLNNNTWELTQEISQSGTGGNFGGQVGISENWIVVSDNCDVEKGSCSGAVYSYKKVNDQWIEDTKLIASDGKEINQFGSFIDLDSNQVIIANGIDNSTVYVYEYIDNQWSEKKLITNFTDPSHGQIRDVSINEDFAAFSSSEDGRTYIFAKENEQWIESTYSLPPYEYEETFNDLAIELYEEELFYSKEDKMYVYPNYERKDGKELEFQQELLFSGKGLKDFMGRAIAIEGDHLAVGAGSFNNNRGTVYTYKRNTDNSWQKRNQLIRQEGVPLDQFGRAISIDGNYMAIGAMGYDDGEYIGLVYIYKLIEDNWSFLTTIDPTPLGGLDWEYFGFSLDMDEDYLVVSAPTPTSHPDAHHHEDEGHGDDKRDSPGKVYVFKRATDDTFYLIDILEENGGEVGDHFGYAVDLSEGTILIGAHAKTHRKGAAFIYQINTELETVEFIQKITAPDNLSAHGDKFGIAVAVKSNHIIVGAPQDENPNTVRGKVFIFQENNGLWSFEKLLEPSDGQKGDRFGWSVAIEEEVAIVGANLSDHNGRNSGVAYIYKGAGNNWEETGKILPADGIAEEQFATVVSLQKNNNFDIIIGASHAEDTRGAAYTFSLPISLYNNCVDEEMEINESNIVSNTYHALQHIYSNGSIKENEEVLFIAGNSITLSAGFEVLPNSIFTALIEPCSNPIIPNDTTIETLEYSKANQIKIDFNLNAYPNPFSDELYIEYELPEDTEASILLFDMMGRMVKTIEPTNFKSAGFYSNSFPLDQLPYNNYYLALNTSRKVKILKVAKIE